MASARVHASSRHRSMVYCVTGDSNPGRVDFKHHSGYSKYKVQTLETLTKFTEQETARVSYQRSAKYYGRSSSRSISGNSNSDRELGEISSGSLCENPLEFNGEGQKSQDLNNKRKYSCFPEDSVDKQFPKLLDDEFEPGQIRESPEFRREEEPFLNIGSSRWGNDDDDDNDSNSPNPKRRKLSSNPSVLLSPNLDNSERRKIASNISGGETLTAESPKCRPEEKPLPNIAASRWADDEDLEISDLKRTNLSSNPDDCDSQEHKKLRLSSVLGVKNSSCSSGGETLSPYDARESARTRSDGSGVSSVCSDIDGGRGSIESSRGAEIGVSDDEHVQMDLDSDEEQVGLDSDQGLPSESDCPTLSPSQLPVLAGRQIDMMQGCKIVDEFERLNKINEGTYGIVYRARNKKTGEIVALKKVKMEREREGFPMSALREINVLLSLQHPSVVNVKEVVVGNNLDNIFMVMEYMEHDLKDFMGMMKQPFSTSEVKCLILQLLEGVNYLHDNWILHRDLKTSNLLINNKGELKICDFGLARQYGSPLKTYTQLVVTLWYRAPELLLGAKKYSTAVDMWSVGCIMAELLSKEPLFSGKSDIDQLDKIFRTMGTPNQKIWPDFANLPGAKCSFVKQPYNKLREKFPAASFSGKQALSESGFDLLNRFLTYDPNKRITAEEALNHQWFREVPLPKSKEFMPTYPSRSDHDRQSRRVMKSPDPLERLRRVEPGELAIGGLFG